MALTGEDKFKRVDENLLRVLEDEIKCASEADDHPFQSKRSELISDMRPFRSEKRKYSTTIDEKMKEIKPLQSDLQGDLQDHRTARERGMGLCSSEHKLNDIIWSLHYRIQHESNTLNEEKKLLKEIKQLEATREKSIDNIALKAALEKEKGSKEDL